MATPANTCSRNCKTCPGYMCRKLKNINKKSVVISVRTEGLSSPSTANSDCSKLDSVRNFKFTSGKSRIARHAYQRHSLRGRQGGRPQPQECRRGGRHPKLAHSSAALPVRCRLSPSIVLNLIQIKNLRSKIINHINISKQRRIAAVAVRLVIRFSGYFRHLNENSDGQLSQLAHSSAALPVSCKPSP